MLRWTHKVFDGNRSTFKYPYLEALKQQLRVINCYRMAIGEELIPVFPESVCEATLFKIADKRDDFERRNQLGYALISMSVTKPVLNKINVSPYTCRSAFSILETVYGGNLTVAEMAFIENLLEKKKDNSETAENIIENWIQLSLQAGITRSVQNDTRQQAKLIKLFEKDKLYSNSIQMSYMTDKNFDEMITLIIKEDENLRSKDQELIKVNFENKLPSTILKISDTSNHQDSTEQNTHNGNRGKYRNRNNRERSPYRGNRESSPYRGNRESSPYRGNRERSPYRGNRDRNDFRTNYQQNSYNRNYQQNNRYLDNNNNKQYRDNREKRSRERSSDRYRSKSNERQKSTHTNTEANKRQRKEDGKCWNFAETGTCKFGENCRFSHSK